MASQVVVDGSLSTTMSSWLGGNSDKLVTTINDVDA